MINVGDTVTSMGKPGIVVDVLTSSSGAQSFIKLASPDLIARNADGNGGELIDIGYHVLPCEKEIVIKAADGYIAMLEDRILKLKEFKNNLEQVTERRINDGEK